MKRLEKFSVFYRNTKTQDFVCRGVHVCSCVCACYRGGKADTAQFPQLQAEISVQMYLRVLVLKYQAWGSCEEEGKRWLLRLPDTELQQEHCFLPSRSQ